MYGRSTEKCWTQSLFKHRADHKLLDDYYKYLRRRFSFSVASAAAAICKGDTCLANDGDTVLMRDANHLNAAGALYVAPYLHIPLLSEPSTEPAAAKQAGVTAALPSQ